MSLPTKAAIYARVSTPIPKNASKEDIERLKRQDTENQLHPMRAFIKRSLWEPTEFVDNMSAVKTRPKLDEMMRRAQQGEFDVVMVWKLDRFARSLPEFVRLVTDLERVKVRFKVLTQDIDTDQQTPTGRMMMNMLAVFAEFERSLIIERINSSLARRRELGLPLGREKVAISPEKLQELLDEGKSVREMAKIVGESKSAVARRIKDYMLIKRPAKLEREPLITTIKESEQDHDFDNID